MTFYVIGGRGRLGQTIASEYESEDIIILEREQYQKWSEENSVRVITEYFEQVADSESTVFIASGLLDPSLRRAELDKVNYVLPKNIIDVALKLGIRVVTFGTVMETLLQSPNFYVQAKIAIADYVKLKASQGALVTHIQLHTLYGAGWPSSFMFLGQILTAIQSNRQFRMTFGQQLREYHHFVDDVKAIRAITESAETGVCNLSHGKPISLKAIAEGIFEVFDKSELLHIGALPSLPSENYDQVLKPIEILKDVCFRDSLPAIIEYLKDCYTQFENEL